MLSREDNERVTRTDAGTPMGEAFRRYWNPFALASELPEADGAPIRVRLLGEDHVAFRDTSGAVGLVSAFCPHRRAPMFFGRNEDAGLRCVYHGWKFDRAGACVDMPSEPADSMFKSKVTIASYPTWEGGGMLWAYLGPPDRQPPPPDYELVRVPATHRFVSKTLQRCNYLQGLEGGLDSSHATIMHRDNIGDRAWLANYESLVPRIDVERTGYGYMYTGIRQYPTEQWVRAYQYVMPAMQMRGSISGNFSRPGIPPKIDGHIWIPLDDENCYVYNFAYSYDASTPFPEEAALAEEIHFGRGPDDLLPDFSLRQNMAKRLRHRSPAAKDVLVHRHQGREHARRRAARRHGPDRRSHERTSRHDRPRDHRTASASTRSNARRRERCRRSGHRSRSVSPRASGRS
jgi:phthalate 4,5-dioxygenase oxygenase subunit